MDAVPVPETLRTQVRQATAEMFEEVARLRIAVEERVATQAQRIQALEEDLAERDQEIARLTARAEGLRTERDTARREAESPEHPPARLERDAARGELQTLKEANAALRQDLTAALSDVQRLAREKDGLLTRMAQLQDFQIGAERLEGLLWEARQRARALGHAVDTLKGFAAQASLSAESLGPLAEDLGHAARQLASESEAAQRRLAETPAEIPAALPEAQERGLRRLEEAARTLEAELTRLRKGEPATAVTSVRPRTASGQAAGEAIRQALERALKGV